MTRKRAPMEMKLDILQVVASGIHIPNQIMYKSNTSWPIMMNFLDSLIDAGCIERRFKKKRSTIYKRYFLTERGKDALEAFNQLRGLVSPDYRYLPTTMKVKA